MEFGVNILEEALETLGASLEERGIQISVVAIGGGVLLLSKYIERPTHDLDLVALMDSDGTYQSANPLPTFLIECRDEVADFLGLEHHWLNGVPTLLLKHGLPEGFEEQLPLPSGR